MPKNNKQFREGKIKLAEFIVQLFDHSGASPISKELVEQELLRVFPQLANKEECPHCGASMQEYVYHFDILCGLLLLAMGKAVRARVSKGLPFTEANQVHIPSLPVSLSVQCRTTISSKLGLVAKVKGASGRQARGVWCITERGWKALRGEAVPAMVKVWRGQIEERFEQVITLAQAFQVHREGIERAIERNKKPKRDYRTEVSQYIAGEWYDLGGAHAGNLL